jgi:hypothetical protein
MQAQGRPIKVRAALIVHPFRISLQTSYPNPLHEPLGRRPVLRFVFLLEFMAVAGIGPVVAMGRGEKVLVDAHCQSIIAIQVYRKWSICR